MKIAFKITVSVFLILALIVCSVTVTVQYTKRSMYFYDIQDMFYETDALEVLFKECPPWQYYSKFPKGVSYDDVASPSLDEVIDDMSNLYEFKSARRCLARCTFVKKVTNQSPSKRTELVFKVNEVALGKYPYEYIHLYFPRNEQSYYTELEQMLNYFDVGYEEGEEYLLFLVIDDSYNTYPQGMERVVVGQRPSAAGNTLLNVTELVYPSYHFITKLSGEYPYIEFYPSLERYDATYFGANSKNVTASEFISLVYQAIESRR